MFFEEILHAINPPQPTSKDNIFAKLIKTIDRNLIEHFQEAVSNVGLLVLMISIKDLEIDFRLIEFKFDLFDWDNEIFLSCRNASIIVLDVTKLLISNFGEDVFVYIGVHVDKLFTDDFIDTRWAAINVNVISEQWVPFVNANKLPS